MARRPGAEELLPEIGRKPLPGLLGSSRDPARPGGGWGAAGFSPGSSGDGDSPRWRSYKLFPWECWRWGLPWDGELRSSLLEELETGFTSGWELWAPLLRLLPQVGRMLQFSSCGNHWRRSFLPGQLPLFRGRLEYSPAPRHPHPSIPPSPRLPAGLPTPRVWGRVDWYQEKASAQMLVVFTGYRPRQTFPVLRTLLGGFGFVRKSLTIKCRLAWNSLWHPGYP